MASPQPNDDPRLSTYSKEKDGSTRDTSPARLAADSAMAEQAGSDYSGPSPVDAPAAAAPTDDPSALDPAAPTGAPLSKQQSTSSAIERSLLKTAMLMFALCVSAHDITSARLTLADGRVPCCP
jgi:hypothetical protein